MAVGVKIPANARIIRNLLMGAQFQHDHLVHFYHLHALDWVDIVSALKADPLKTAQLSDNVSNAQVGGIGLFQTGAAAPADICRQWATRAPSPTPTGAIRPTNCRPKPI